MSEIRFDLNDGEKHKVDFLMDNLKIKKRTDLIRYLLTDKYEKLKEREKTE